MDVVLKTTHVHSPWTWTDLCKFQSWGALLYLNGLTIWFVLESVWNSQIKLFPNAWKLYSKKFSNISLQNGERRILIDQSDHNVYCYSAKKFLWVWVSSMDQLLPPDLTKSISRNLYDCQVTKSKDNLLMLLGIYLRPGLSNLGHMYDPVFS